MGPIDPHDAVPIRVLKTLLRASLPNIRSRVQEAIEGSFKTCMNHGELSSGGITHYVTLGSPFDNYPQRGNL